MATKPHVGTCAKISRGRYISLYDRTESPTFIFVKATSNTVNAFYLSDNYISSTMQYIGVGEYGLQLKMVAINELVV